MPVDVSFSSETVAAAQAELALERRERPLLGGNRLRPGPVA